MPLPLAVLCTPDKTYEIKQVQTSNTVLILRQSPAKAGDIESVSSGLEAFASCASTIELHAFKHTSKSQSALQHLRESLPTYHSDTLPQPGPLKKSDHFANIPFSEAECEEAWTQLLAFEHSGQAFQSAESLLLEMWKSIVKCFDVTDSNMASDVLQTLDRDFEYPPELSRALLGHISVSEAQGDRMSFSKDKVILWLNEIYISRISALSTNSDIQRILEVWMDLLPGGWVDKDTEARLLALSNNAHGGPKSDSSSTGKAATGGVKRIGKSTNWHEKLKKKRTI